MAFRETCPSYRRLSLVVKEVCATCKLFSICVCVCERRWCGGGALWRLVINQCEERVTLMQHATCER